LICIARALLRDTKVLVLGEATAGIDIKTDYLVQEMITKHFPNCTVLTIAHRLNTILESDKILVLEDGQLAEFDAPQTLLQDDCGHFFKLVEISEKASDQVKAKS
jgi:ABC-type multidrug transport system fused ATPase/permease subunit